MALGGQGVGGPNSAPASDRLRCGSFETTSSRDLYLEMNSHLSRSKKLHSHPTHSLSNDPLQGYRLDQPDRYSAKKMAKPVPFSIYAPQAKAVFLLGDFNDWDEQAHPLERQPDGAWRLEVPLNHGHHHYLFLVDGKRMLDPRANGVARDHRGQKVSLAAVS